ERADVALRRQRQLLVTGDAGRDRLPAREALVLRLKARDVLRDRRQVGHRGPVEAVSDADRDLVELVQTVELRDRHGLGAGELDRGPRDQRVEPARAAGTARGGPVLVTALSQELARLVGEPGRKRPLSDAGRVGLQDEQARVESARRNLET